MGWFKKKSPEKGGRFRYAIGRPSDGPSEQDLLQLREAVSGSGADLVYWFWWSVEQDTPHLGIAFSPFSKEVGLRIGDAINEIWTRLSPSNDHFDVVALGDPKLESSILKYGEVLFDSSDEWLE